MSRGFVAFGAFGVATALAVSVAAATPTEPANARPRTIVAWYGNPDGTSPPSRLVELSSARGAVRREIARRQVGSSKVEVAGGEVYIDRVETVDLSLDEIQEGATGCTELVQHGAIGSAELEDVAPGQLPTVSPGGQRVAYIRRCDPERDQLVVRDVATGTERVWGFPDQPGRGRSRVQGLSGWDGDNRRLVVRVVNEPYIEFWYVDADAPGDVVVGEVVATSDQASGGPVQLVPLGDSSRWAGLFLDRVGRNPRLLELAGPGARRGPVLLAWPELPDDAGFEVVGVDQSGHHLLLVTHPNGGTPALYRWSRGERTPTRLAKGVDAADW